MSTTDQTENRERKQDEIKLLKGQLEATKEGNRKLIRTVEKSSQANSLNEVYSRTMMLRSCTILD